MELAAEIPLHDARKIGRKFLVSGFLAPKDGALWHSPKRTKVVWATEYENDHTKQTSE